MALTATSYTIQTAFTDIHKALLQAKLSHYVTKSYAAHEAFGKTYDAINELIDSITEKLIGYSDTDPGNLVIGTIAPMECRTFALYLIGIAERLEEFALKNKYPDISNLAQELGGVGAQLKYLCRFK